MAQNNNYNSAKIYTGTSCGELRVSAPHSKSVISATNNRAKYYAELSEKYKEEARKYKEEAKSYAEKNSDVTMENLENLELSLQKEIALKQPVGDYAFKGDLPRNVSELNNDAEYVVSSELETVVNELKLPDQESQFGKVLITDGEKTHWMGINSFNLFDTKLVDRILTYEETKGWALQGTYVYKESLAGSYYGYPTFYEECLAQKTLATATEITLGENTITIYIHSNGHQFYDIADKEFIDAWFDTYGTAWFYGIDTENERIFLPRNNWFEQATSDISEVGLGVEAGLPNIIGRSTSGIGSTTNSDTLITWIGALGYEVYGSKSNGAGGSTYCQMAVNLDASKFSDVYGNSDTVQPNAVKKLLYICVGNTMNFAGMVNVVNQGMEILEQVNQGFETRIKVDGSNARFPYIVETYVNGTSGYNIYSNRYCEQWGQVSVSTTTNNVAVAFLKEFEDTNYNIQAHLVTNVAFSSNSGTVNVNGAYSTGAVLNRCSATGFYISRLDDDRQIYWRACGYIL